MIDLHTHTLLSDGALIPAELCRRAEVIGYRAIAIADHVDYTNAEFVVSKLVRACKEAEYNFGDLTVLPGAELTHVPPRGIPKLVARIRSWGAQVIVVHGETIAEPVAPGTNRAALESDIDILAHPGLITPEDVQRAAKRGIYLEITAKKGHSLTNGHVAALARHYGASLVLNTDAHEPGDLISLDQARRIARGAAMSDDEIERMFANSACLVNNVRRRQEV